jgi:GxxExxY protein
MELNELTQKIIGCAIEVHKELGPGLLESIYEEALCYELEKKGLKVQRQKSLEINYKGIKLNGMLKLDVLIEGRVIVELKSVKSLEKIHEAQLISYLKLSGKKLGLLINFNEIFIKNGLKRLVL